MTVTDIPDVDGFMAVTQGDPWRSDSEVGKGVKTKGVGIMQIVAGLLHLVCAVLVISTALSASFYYGLYFWGAVTYVLTGILTITADSKSLCLVKLCVLMNMLSIITAGIIGCLLAVDFAIGGGFKLCYGAWNAIFCHEDESSVQTTRGMLMIMSGFQFIVSIIKLTFLREAHCPDEPVASVSPNQAAYFAGRSPFQPSSCQQDLFYITPRSMNLNNLPTDDPPPYSECVAQTTGMT